MQESCYVFNLLHNKNSKTSYSLKKQEELVEEKNRDVAWRNRHWPGSEVGRIKKKVCWNTSHWSNKSQKNSWNIGKYIDVLLKIGKHYQSAGIPSRVMECVYTYIYVHTLICINIHIYIYIWAYMHMYICIYMYVCIYLHECTCTYKNIDAWYFRVRRW